MKKLLLIPLCMVLLAIGTVSGQFTISGIITDGNGEAVIGANVIEKGTSNGTITDIDGSYNFSVTNSDAIIEVSYIGLTTVEIPVAGQSNVSFVMQEDSKLLDEVVVTALGVAVKRDEQGSTYSVIEPEDISRSGETTLINSLGAKASNVRINRSNGDPGAGSTIRIRGANTISGSGSPLIIVDGSPLNNNTTYGGGNNLTGGRTGGISQQSRLNDINPNDIESVNILKGASAAALYGSRAANGVIVITTKEGSSGAPKISYKATLSIDKVSERVEMQNTFGQGRNGSFSEGTAEAWGDYIPERSGGADVVDESGEHFISDNGPIYYPIDEKNSTQTFVDQNWDDVIGTGGFLQHDFSISGGNDKANYFFSLGRMDQEGIIKNSFYDRTNVRFNNKVFLNDWMTLSTKSAYTNSASNRIQQSSNTAGLMLGLLRTSPDFNAHDYLGTYVDDDGSLTGRRHRSYRRPLGDRDNPTYNNALWTTNEQSATSGVNRFVVTPQLDFNPLGWLTFTLRGSADISSDARGYFFSKGSGGDRSGGIFAEDAIGTKEYNFDAFTKGNFSLSPDIDLTATVGWSLNERNYKRTSGTIRGFLVNTVKETTSLNTAAENSEFENFKTRRRSNRGYGVLGFDILDEIYVNLSGALEASSTVKGSFFYPAMDVAWQFGDRLNTRALSFGKLRLSWGKVGVQPSPHQFETLAEGGFGYSTYSDLLSTSLYGGGFRIDNNLGNPDLIPEVKTEWEIGADLRFLDDKLGVSGTYYRNEIQDILIDLELTPSSGFSTQYGNFATMENNGFEMDLSYNAINRSDMSLNFLVNFARNKNMVTDLEGTETIDLTPGASVSSRAVVGYPLGVLYGTGSQTDENGDFILDENGFPQLTTSPEVLGDPNPDWRGGAGFNFNFKNFGLNVLLEHSQGGDFSPRTLWVLRRFGTTAETANLVTLSQDLVNFDGEVIPAGTRVRGNIENFGGGDVILDETWYRHGIGGGFGDNQAYNFSLADATFTKLREVTLSYRLGSDIIGKSLNGVTVSATARNLFNWNKIDGIDPETNQVGVSNGFGVEYFTNPMTASYLFSIGVDF